jgi:phosphate:Na+ symporter
VFTLGVLVGGVTQSTLASAALNAGLVASRLVTTPAAAAAFVGALLGAGVVPLWTGLLDPRAGLVVIAIGVLWLGVATDRRTRAMARLALGVGLVALGLHLMRNGIEPLVVDKALLQLTSGLHANTVGGLLACVAIGAVLTAILQGAAATLFVVVGLLQTVGQLDLHVVLLVLAGSGLGAALGALLTAGSETVGPRLAKLYLLLGAAHTVVTALTARLWLGVAIWAVPVSEPLATFGKNALRPHLSMQLVLAVVCSQLAAALLILPWVNPLNRWLKQRQRATSEQDTPPAALSTREALLEIVRLQREGLQRLWA